MDGRRAGGRERLKWMEESCGHNKVNRQTFFHWLQQWLFVTVAHCYLIQLGHQVPGFVETIIFFPWGVSCSCLHWSAHHWHLSDEKHNITTQNTHTYNQHNATLVKMKVSEKIAYIRLIEICHFEIPVHNNRWSVILWAHSETKC